VTGSLHSGSPTVAVLSFAKIPSGAQVVDLSDLTTPRAGYSCRSTGRRSPCLRDVDPGDNSTGRIGIRP
jgi:hypothetical protein